MATAGKAAPKRNKSRSVNATEVAALGRLLPFERFFLRTFAEKKKEKEERLRLYRVSISDRIHFRGGGEVYFIVLYSYFISSKKKKQKNLFLSVLGAGFRQVSGAAPRVASGRRKRRQNACHATPATVLPSFTAFSSHPNGFAGLYPVLPGFDDARNGFHWVV